jgi:hypothetical protein
MFPWHIILVKGLEATASHTARGSAVKTVRCEACHCQYAYRLSREAVGTSSDFLVADAQAAKQNASDELRKLLERECDPVPCPTCGWYQRNMVRRARQLRYRPLGIATEVLFVITFL